MRKAIRTYSKNFMAIVFIAVVALGVGGYILSNQRFYLPKFFPWLGTDFVTYKIELPTAQAITPGQGQTVDVAGVPVGDIQAVNLVDGRAMLTVKIRKKDTPLYKNATALVRPKTGLDDMIVELSPGSRSAGIWNPKVPLDVSQTTSNVNLDEILSALDSDTRNYLVLLLGGAGQGLNNNSRNLSNVFRRFAPTSRDLDRITHQLSLRHENIRRTIDNFRVLTEALGNKDTQLTQFVDSSNAVFKAFADQDAKLRETLGLLPGALQATRTGLQKADTLATNTGRTLGRLRPAARALGPSLRETQPFLKTTTPVIKNQLRPFTRDALPVTKLLRPAANDLAKATPGLTTSFSVINYLLNEIAYEPTDGRASYLFYTAWANHDAGTVFSLQDAEGPIRRGLLLVSCAGLAALSQLGAANPQLSTLFQLTNEPSSSICSQSSQAGSGSGTTTSPLPVPVPTVPGVPAVPATTAKAGAKRYLLPDSLSADAAHILAPTPHAAGGGR